MKTTENIQRLETILAALGSLAEQMVFTGGAVVELYLQNPTEMRPTKDVDCIVSANTLAQYTALERGFENAGFTEPGSPICRYKYKDTLFDMMPSNSAVLGFANSWFGEAIENSFYLQLPSGKQLRLASVPYLIAIKLETMKNRASSDFRTSHDLEDIICLSDGAKNVNSLLKEAPKSVRHYIQSTLTELLENDNFVEAVRACAPEGFEQANRVFGVFKSLRP